MQIGALGFVNTVVSKLDGGQMSTSKNKGFARLLSGLTEDVKVGKDVPQLNEVVQQLSKEELSELIQFLSSTDLSESKYGSEMMNLMLLNEDLDMTDRMKESLHLTDEEVISAITSYLKDLDLEKIDESTGLSEEEFSKIVEELPLMDVNDALTAFVSILPFIHLDENTFKTDQNFADLVKSLKLFELLSNESKTNVNQQQLQDFLQKIIEKLETSMKESTLSSKNEFLHKLFTPIVKELNEQTLKSQPFQTALSTEPLRSTIENENIEVSQTNTLNGKIVSFQQMSKPYELTLTQSQSGNKVSTDQLIQQFESILSKSQLMNAGGNQKLFIKLYPEHLGALRVELIQKDSTLIAKFMTTTANAKDILESQIQSLKQAFSSQNIQIEKIEISQQLNQQERYFNRDSQQQQEQRQQREQDKLKQQQDQTFTLSFEEELLNVEV